MKYPLLRFFRQYVASIFFVLTESICMPHFVCDIYCASNVALASRINVLNLSACHAARPVKRPSMDGWTISSLALPGFTLPPYNTGISFPASPKISIKQALMTLCISSA